MGKANPLLYLWCMNSSLICFMEFMGINVADFYFWFTNLMFLTGYLLALVIVKKAK